MGGGQFVPPPALMVFLCVCSYFFQGYGQPVNISMAGANLDRYNRYK